MERDVLVKERVIEAGRLRHVVAIQQSAVTPNEFNEQEVNWQTVATVDANIEPLSGRELWAAAQAQSQVSHKLTMRYYKGLTAKMRLMHHDYTLGKDRVFNIESITNAGEVNRKMIVMATEET